jgi:FkbM family methyltransferase
MPDPKVTIAESGAYRRRGRGEALAAGVGRMIGAGPVRRVLRSAYHALLGLRAGGKGLPSTLPGGEVVRVLPAFRFVTWNDAEYHAFRAALKPGGTALDVGANVGAYSVLFGMWAGPTGRVLAFEPAPEAFDGLTRHVALNGVGGTVQPRRAAVSDTSGGGTLLAEGFHGTNRLVDAGTADAGSMLAVPTVTIDDLCAAEGLDPTLIKIDVEGAELQVLRGARETIRRMGDRLALFVEMHPTLWAASGISAADVRAELEAQGLRAEALSPSDDPWSLEGECLRVVRR